MADYRRSYRAGGTYFFTLVSSERLPIFETPMARRCLRMAIGECRQSRPFEIAAAVFLPDHLHFIWTLPEGDVDYSRRISFLKSMFTRQWLASGGQESLRSHSRVLKEERGVWQRRFWEHTIADEEDFNRHVDYIHYNPVKHGLASCPHAWPYSSFERWVRADGYEPGWQCVCEGRRPQPMMLDEMAARSE